MTIMEIISHNDLDRLKRLLEEDQKASEIQDENGAWMVQLAALSGNYELMKYLVEHSVTSFNLTDNQGNNTLHYGVRSGNPEIVKYLVEQVGISVVSGNQLGITPFDLAHDCGFTEIEQYFEKLCGCQLSDMYHNPILKGFHADPSVLRVGEDYYMVNSSFVFFPCIPILHSKDLIHWKVIGHAITNPDWAELGDLEGGRGYWAPDISYYEGRFYIAATYRMNDSEKVWRKQMVTSSEKPEGPYSKPVFINEDGIDPSIFTDLDGRRYMLINRGARIFEISPDGTEVLSEPKLLWYGDQKRAPEGPHILYKDEYYYLFIAEGGTGRGHRIAVARSRNLMGPYENCPYNPIMRQWDENAPIQCCGHGKPVQTAEGDWYMVYLCNRYMDGNYGILGRETCLDPITWTSDGWPLVNQLRGPSMLQKKPAIKALPVEEEISSYDSFPQPSFWREWRMPRGTNEVLFGHNETGFWLRGSGQDLCDMKCRSVLVLSQPSFIFSMECLVTAKSLEDGNSIGLTCYYDENSYLKFGLANEKGILGILVQEYVDDVYITNEYMPLDSGTLDSAILGSIISAELKIDTDGLKRTCSFRLPGESWKEFCILEDTSYLSSEGLRKGKRFTGAMAGIYVHGSETGIFNNFHLREVKKHGF